MVTNECIKSSCCVFIIKQKNNIKASLAQCLCSVYRPLWSHKCIKCSCFVCILKQVRQIWGKVPGGPGIKSSQSCSNSPAIARQSPRMSRGWGGGGNKWLVHYRNYKKNSNLTMITWIPTVHEKEATNTTHGMNRSIPQNNYYTSICLGFLFYASSVRPPFLKFCALSFLFSGQNTSS